MLAEIINFLEILKENNNREWFAANKPWHDKLKKEFEAFAVQLITVIGKIDKDIAYLEPKDCTYRIYRDTRFSTDKTPYKTNMGVYMVKGGKNSGNAGYYVHIEPGMYFLAGGVWMPMPDTLKKIRTDIYENIDEFLEIINDNQFKKHFKDFDQELKLKNPPKDFPKDFKYIDYLKYKSYTVSKPINSDLLLSKGFFKEVEDVFSALSPLNKFLNQAITN